jgi:DNA-binding CsgD family transcriptional regulator
MGLRNPRREELARLSCKTLDAQFTTTLRDGLNCSPFEAHAVLDVVREIYAPVFAEAPAAALPGRITLVAVDADEPAGKPVADCIKCTIVLHLHRGGEDDRLIQAKGPEGFRLARLPDLCQQALSQGGLLTREDLAYRVFFVSTRTISRDLLALRKADPKTPLPLRSNIHDIGPVLTHRTQIVRLALQGKTTTQICQIMKHSAGAVANYVSTFTRCAQLAQEQMEVGQIAFLLRRGPGLIQRYLELLAECRKDKNMSYHLQELLKIGQAGAGSKKKSATTGRRP